MNSRVITVAISYADPFAREGIINLLNRNSNIKVLYDAYNGDDLLRLLVMKSLIPDIVVLEMEGNLMQNLAVQTRLKQKYCTTKIIVISKANNDYTITKTIERGAMAYLVKSNNIATELISAISDVIDNQFYYGQVDRTLAEKARRGQTPDLTEKEIQFLTFCCQGLSAKEIAAGMCISTRTAGYYYATVCQKLGVSENRIKLAAFAMKAGIVSLY